MLLVFSALLSLCLYNNVCQYCCSVLFSCADLKNWRRKGMLDMDQHAYLLQKLGASASMRNGRRFSSYMLLQCMVENLLHTFMFCLLETSRQFFGSIKNAFNIESY